MKIRITTLSENTASVDHVAEWGLSMLVEANNVKILFDTGAGTAAMINTTRTGIDLSDIDCIVLSHGHHDHTGGLYELLKQTGPKPIVAHPKIWSRKFSCRKNTPERFIGIPYRRDALEALGADFRLSVKPQFISQGITTTGEVPMMTDYEAIDSYLCVKERAGFKPDPLADDLSLVIDTNYGLVVILGCAHRGIINTLEQARRISGKNRIYAAVGGTHLIHATPHRLKKTSAALLEMDIQYLAACHCTGFAASAFLAERFGDRFIQNHAGTQLTLPISEATASINEMKL